jgi:peptidoglycan hydrolase-like protein with peptidoglycan-binding domain
MPLQSGILAGNPRLESAFNGGPSVKQQPPADDPSAVRCIQRALVALGFLLPNSFPDGPNGAPDGVFGHETFNAVQAYQRREFPNQFSEWDGRVGQKTLGRMDAQLPAANATSAQVPGAFISTRSRCVTGPHNTIVALRPRPHAPAFQFPPSSRG